jgi:hypothetical protein
MFVILRLIIRVTEAGHKHGWDGRPIQNGPTRPIRIIPTIDYAAALPSFSPVNSRQLSCQRALKTSHLWALKNQPS